MRIRLNDIPEEGKAFEWNRETGELNAVLSDLVGDEPHATEFFVRPINSKNFELTGFIRTNLPEDCSRCGIAFKFDVDVNFREILIPKQPEDRTGRYAKVNHLSDIQDEGPSVAEYDADDTFDMGEYLHEQVGITIPFNPAPAEDEKGDCRLCGINVRGKVFSYDEAMPVERKNPFEALKSLKLDEKQ